MGVDGRGLGGGRVGRWLVHPGRWSVVGGRWSVAGAGRPADHLHVVTVDSWGTRNERLLRDHLLAHPADAARYAQLKWRLHAEGLDGDAYTRAKTPLIQELVDRARTDRGLPCVPVWEE